jgi:hypothetical protein
MNAVTEQFVLFACFVGIAGQLQMKIVNHLLSSCPPFHTNLMREFVTGHGKVMLKM